jgi:[protein-PII] uridylyltransferase
MYKTDMPVVAARISSVGEGLQVLVYAPDRSDLFSRVSVATLIKRWLQHPGCTHPHHNASGYVLDTFQIMASDPIMFDGVHYRDLIALVETQLAQAVASEPLCTNPCAVACLGESSHSRFNHGSAYAPTSAVNAGCSACRPATAQALLYVIARTLANHHVNVQLAKVSTLGERVEDTFFVTGQSLTRDRAQLDLEQNCELLVQR